MEQEYQHWLLALSAPMVALNIDYGARSTMRIRFTRRARLSA
ncbi:hypothetical protein [Dickeya fangzhongdai]|nr:hypothetical protein [Dickeya fangzhongdai]